MAFGRKIHDGTGPVLTQKPTHKLTVAYIPMHKEVSGIIRQPGQIVRIACLGQQIKVHHAGHLAGPYRMNEIRTDETGTAGYKPRCFHDGV